MLDWEGHMIQKTDRQQILLSDIAEDTDLAASVQVGSIELRAIDIALDTSFEDDDLPEPNYWHIP